MNMKELISAVSAETSIPAGKVRKVATAVLTQLANVVETEGEFKSPVMNIKARVRPADTFKAADGTTKARPERRLGIIKVKEAKAKA